MSIINLALQNIAIAREKTENMEGFLHLMQDIRKAASVQQALKHEWQKSPRSIMELVNDRFERLSLKGKQIFTEEYAKDIEIDALIHLIQRIDHTVDCDHLQQKDVVRKLILASHTRSRQYSF